jgi:hypothetical protein
LGSLRRSAASWGFKLRDWEPARNPVGLITATILSFPGSILALFVLDKLPDEVNIVNSAVSWSGVHWTMVMWPPPENPQARARLMAHEL